MTKLIGSWRDLDAAKRSLWPEAQDIGIDRDDFDWWAADRMIDGTWEYGSAFLVELVHEAVKARRVEPADASASAHPQLITVHER